ncbi:MAG: phosphatidylglycerophosphate synthase [Bacteroidia bacterium]|jgi:phosphatidylglycerophosphate synthase
MQKLRNQIPFYLIYSRVVSALALILLAFTDFAERDFVIAALILLGLVSDFFDGFLARKWGISTEKLRIWDSNVDQVFWVSAIGSIFYLNQAFVLQWWQWIVVVVALETGAYFISYFRFRKPVATHSILSKIWIVTLLFFLIDLCILHTSSWFFWSCVIIGIISRLEIVLILLLLKKWVTDVPSVIQVSKINKGISIKKSKWFNS